jgi:hypothetical protein
MAKRKWNNGDWYNYNLRKYQSRESNSLVKERDEKIEQIEKIKNLCLVGSNCLNFN